MQIYTIFITIALPLSEPIDEIWMMARFSTVIEKYFKVLGRCHHIFGRGAFTYMLILAESHAVIQTYPELNTAFITLEFHEENNQHKIDDRACADELVRNLGGVDYTTTKYAR